MALIQKYRIGDSIETEAVVEAIPITDWPLEEWAVNSSDKLLSRRMTDSDIVYGLGESLRGINKRGWLYTSSNTAKEQAGRRPACSIYLIILN